MRYIALLFCFSLISSVLAQKPQQGQVITDFGKTYNVPNPDFKTNINAPFKVVFDVGRNIDNPSQINPLLETAARFINMHKKSGVPLSSIQVALVVHGSAANDLLNKDEYNKRYETNEIIDNPNTPLICALNDSGVQIILCGQTAAFRKITKKILHPDVKIALSAMTALVQLQNDGYRLINF